MIIAANVQNGALVATIQVSEANLTISDSFKDEMLELIDKENKFIVVDFAQVTYVDSSFLGALVASLKHAIPNNADIVVAGLNKDILGLFQLIRLDKAFKVFETPNDAIANKAM